MAKKNINEFVADHEGGDVVQGGRVMEPVDGAGGPVQPRMGDVKQPVNPEADEIEEITPGNGKVQLVKDVDVNEAFDSLFEGMDLSEGFKGKMALVFEAAVNEAVEQKTSEITEQLEEQFAGQLEESVNEAVEGIVENLDSYLDYVVTEWMEENKLAVESGLKVEMADSLMNSLKTVFYEHNIAVDENTIDVVSELEEQLQKTEAKANAAINRIVELTEQNEALQASAIFNEVCEGLTVAQTERFRVLSEKLSFDDSKAYKQDLLTLKESFFKSSKAPVVQEQREEMLMEDTAPKAVKSQYDSVNALAAAISTIKIK